MILVLIFQNFGQYSSHFGRPVIFSINGICCFYCIHFTDFRSKWHQVEYGFVFYNELLGDPIFAKFRVVFLWWKYDHDIRWNGRKSIQFELVSVSDHTSKRHSKNNRTSTDSIPFNGIQHFHLLYGNIFGGEDTNPDLKKLNAKLMMHLFICYLQLIRAAFSYFLLARQLSKA